MSKARTCWKRVGGSMRKVRIDAKGRWHFLKGVKGRCPYCGKMRGGR